MKKASTNMLYLVTLKGRPFFDLPNHEKKLKWKTEHLNYIIIYIYKKKEMTNHIFFIKK